MKVTERTLFDLARLVTKAHMHDLAFGVKIITVEVGWYEVHRQWRRPGLGCDQLSDPLPARECYRWLQGFAVACAHRGEVRS